jgi:transcriptional regulator with XRE-family HTH domain
MTALGQWLQDELRRRDLSLQSASTYSGVSIATISDIIRKNHVPRLETLFRLADYFDTPREQVVRLAAQMPLESDESDGDDEIMVAELLEEFRKVPDAWKPVVLDQVAWLRRLAEQPPAHIIGEENSEAERQAETQTA